MEKYRDYSLAEYSNALSARKPVPGGGSAAAYTAALGASLMAMVANYSISEKQTVEHNQKFKKLLTKAESLRDRFLELVDLDAQAYLRVVESKNGSEKEKQSAEEGARRIPQEICELCYQAVDLAPFLVSNGNKYLLSDVEVAIELLQAAFNGAKVMTK